MDKVKVAVVGLGFGAEFIPIYQRHPDAECYAICQRNEEHLNEIGDQFGIERRFTKFADLLAIDELDAIHVVSPIADHAQMTLASLNAGKHTACTVPMATTTEDCMVIVEARKKSGKVYMMMETAVYSREFLYARELVASGKLGKIQFLRGSHQQNMGLPGWPEYWYGFPPMHYATHAVSPLLWLAGDGCVIYSGFEDAERIEIPDYAQLLPKEIAPFTGAGVYDEEHEHTSFIQGSGHGGSHPHLSHEFIRAIVENRPSTVDAENAANWTMTGICAHESAMKNGERIKIPR